MTLPITLIGGYLGSGKTTLVNHLLRHADGLRLAVLVNEFGELPIDQDLIEAQDDNIISIAGGCVCCSYGNDLTLALMDMSKLDPPPDHVLLEASGVALPGAIAASVSLLPGYAVDGIIVLVNAETIQEQASDTYIGDTISRQLESADLLILNKADLLPNSDNKATAEWLQKQVSSTEIIPASYGKLPPQLVLQSFLNNERITTYSHVHEPELFTTFSLAITHTVDVAWLAEALAEKSLGLVRAKGFATSPDGQLMTIQVVGRRWAVSPAPASAKAGLVVIGHTNSVNQAIITEQLNQAASYC